MAKRGNVLACKAQSRMHSPAPPNLPEPTWRRENEGPQVVHLEDGHMSLPRHIRANKIDYKNVNNNKKNPT